MVDISKPPKQNNKEDYSHQNDRISEVSNVNRKLSDMQKQIENQLLETAKDLKSPGRVGSIQGSMINVLNKLSSTVGTIGSGFSKIAIDTARTSSDAIVQYGQAIREDIKINRQHLLSMTIAQSTPIYGYFIAKFMETNVWKSATEKLKNNISSMLSAVGEKSKDIIRKIPTLFRKGKEDETPTQKSKKLSDKIPHMQKGGYVERAGLAKVHAAEVVMPIEKILSRIDESISVSKSLAISAKHFQLQSLAKISGYVKDQEAYQKTGLINGFFRALRSVQTRYNEPANIRMLRALLAIQNAIGASVGTWSQVWQKMLIEHPVLRNTLFFLRSLYKTIGMPVKLIYGIFKSRGGYKGHLSRSSNPGQATAENVGMLYSEGMWKLDNIISFVRATAEATRDIASALTGKVYPPVEGVARKGWSLFGLSRSLLNFFTKYGLKALGLIPTGIGKGTKALTGETKFTNTLENLGTQVSQLADILTEKRKVRDIFRLFKKDGSDIQSIPDMIEVGRKAKLEEQSHPVIELKRIREIKELEEARYKEDQSILMAVGSDIVASTEMQSGKIISLQERANRKQKTSSENIESHLSKSSKFLKKIVKSSDDTADSTDKLNKREKRRTISGFFSEGLGMITKFASSALGGILPLIMGLGGGFLVSSLKTAFLGKVVTGGILGVLGKKLVDIIKRTVIKFPKIFMRSLFPALKALPFLLGASGPLGLKIAAIAGLVGGGVWLVKSLNKWADNNKTIQEIRTKLTQDPPVKGITAQDVLQEAINQAAKSREETVDIKRQQLSDKDPYGAGLLDWQELLKKNVGAHGVGQLSRIAEGKYKYMQENYDEYLKYKPDHVDLLRGYWLEQGGYSRGKGFLENPEKYGMKREEAFLKYLKKHGQPISVIERFKDGISKGVARFTESQENALSTIPKQSFIDSLTDQREMQDILPESVVGKSPYIQSNEVKEKEASIFFKALDLARQKANILLKPSTIIKDELERNAMFYQKSTEGQGERLVNAINTQTTVISNTNNTSYTNVPHGGPRGAMNRMMDNYTELTIRGEVDGD